MTPIIHLAPMDGVMDALMRKVILRYDGVSECSSEFVRVSDNILPKHVFEKACPELLLGGYVADVPIRLQLLGSDPELMAQNALRALEYGAYAIDLNFGCPSKTVNKSRGGAYLLQFPQKIHEITLAVRRAIGDDISLSAKMRLGYEHADDALIIARAIEEAGVDILTVHARTKKQGYTPPALWDDIKVIRQKLHIPLIANGDIFTVEDAQKCMEVTGCHQLMIGRGSLMRPNIASMITQGSDMLTWQEIIPLLIYYGDISLEADMTQYYARRIKQWLRYLMLAYNEAFIMFEEIKTLTQYQDIYHYLLNQQG